MPVPDYQSLMLPVLKALADGCGDTDFRKCVRVLPQRKG